jgi:cell division ATPase FtsA
LKINWGVIIAVAGTSLQAVMIAAAIADSAAKTQTDIAVLKTQVAAIAEAQKDNSEAIDVLVDRFVDAGFSYGFGAPR